ncbi:DUF6113 family protein [Streptomyces sp. PKU-EA00015]|uniref:DUF6113 family protein n=1 Tax=Streptomyces sp. PKU-EA00015 TaxID=2748326 RepID=UPI00210D1106|nr:DUF6113 family protein [Streptomyces sp. PKU-EA00015]
MSGTTGKGGTRGRADTTGKSGTKGQSGKAGSGGAAGQGGAQGPGGGAAGSFLARPPRPGRAVAYLGLALLGAAVGIAGSLLQGAWFPGGLALALAATAALFYGSLRVTGGQLGVAASAVGWLLSIVVLSVGRPEGDAMFTSGIGPLVYMLGGMATAVICATLSRLPQQGGGPGRLGGQP